MKPVIQVKPNVIEEIQATFNLNDSKLALKTGLNSSQIGRVKKKKCSPGADFIAGMLVAFPDKKFEDIFFLYNPLQEGQEETIHPPTGTDLK